MAGVCFSPRKRKNCQVNCCVVNCNSSAQKNPNIRFYIFSTINYVTCIDNPLAFLKISFTVTCVGPTANFFFT